MKRIALFALILLAVFCAPVWAAEDAPAATAEKTVSSSGPQIVKVGVYIISIGKLDIITGSFTVDFYMSMKSDQSLDNINFEFLNGRGTAEIQSDEQNEKKQCERWYRILANLSSTIDFKKFPFDEQTLQIIIEDKKKTARELVFVADTEGSDLDNSVSFAGWDIKGAKAEVKAHPYKAFNETYSQFVFNIDITRIKFNSFLKTFLPMFFLILIMISTFILNPDQVITRLAAISSTLMATVMFHISISNQIPPVGYLTFADKFMMLTYFLLLVSFALNIAIFVMRSKNREDNAATFNKWCEKLVFIGVPVLYAALFLLVS